MHDARRRDQLIRRIGTEVQTSRGASDEFRQTYLSFAVSGTPTFVLIDADGKIEWRHTGFSAKDGLKIP